MNEHFIMLMASPQGEGGGWGAIIPWVLVIVIFYFFMIRPQTKKAKEQKKFRENLSKDDKVVTIGGIHGKVQEVKDDYVILSVEDGTRMRVEKNAISMDSTTQLTEDQKS